MSLGKWAPHIAVLPAVYPHIIEWDPEELDELEGCNIKVFVRYKHHKSQWLIGAT